MPFTARQAAKAKEIDAIIQQCSRELAMNFECPSDRILGVYGAKLGITSKQMLEAIYRYNERTKGAQ